MADIKRFALTLAVGVLLALFVGFLVDAIYSSPQYNDFCDGRDRFIPKFPERINTSLCSPVDYSDSIYDTCTGDMGYVAYESDENGCEVTPYCETCGVDYDNASEKYSRNLFFILAPLSLLLIAIGVFIITDSIAAGFILGGILTLIYSTIRVFGDLSKVMKVVILGVELALVIWLGYRFVERGSLQSKSPKKK